MCRYSTFETNYRPVMICLDCQIGWKGQPTGMWSNPKWQSSNKCGRCGNDGINMGFDFHTPRKNNKNQWRKIKLMLENNEPFHSCGCNGPGLKPRTLADAKIKYGK